MSHVREQIRDAIVTLVTGLTTTTSHVHVNRSYKLTEAELPALRIYTLGDIPDEENSQPLRTVRDMEIVIEGVAQAKTALDEKLDDICAEVEAAIAADDTLSGKVWWTRYQGTETEMDDDTHAVPVGVAKMAFSARFEINRTDPTTLLLRA